MQHTITENRLTINEQIASNNEQQANEQRTTNNEQPIKQRVITRKYAV